MKKQKILAILLTLCLLLPLFPAMTVSADPPYDIDYIEVVDGGDGWTPVSVPVIGQVLYANVITTNGDTIGVYPLDPDLSYEWYYFGTGGVLGTDPVFTVTSDNVDKILCVDVWFTDDDSNKWTWMADGIVEPIPDFEIVDPDPFSGLVTDCGEDDTGARLFDVYYIASELNEDSDGKYITFKIAGFGDVYDFMNVFAGVFAANDPNSYTIDGCGNGDGTGTVWFNDSAWDPDVVDYSDPTIMPIVEAQLYKDRPDYPEPIYVGSVFIRFVPVAKYIVNIDPEEVGGSVYINGCIVMYDTEAGYEDLIGLPDYVGSSKNFACLTMIGDYDGLITANDPWAHCVDIYPEPYYIVKSLTIDPDDFLGAGDAGLGYLSGFDYDEDLGEENAYKTACYPAQSTIYEVYVEFGADKFPIPGIKEVDVISGTPNNEVFNFKMELVDMQGDMIPFESFEKFFEDYPHIEDESPYIYTATKTYAQVNALDKGFEFDIGGFLITDLVSQMPYLSFIFKITEDKGGTTVGNWTYDGSVYYVKVWLQEIEDYEGYSDEWVGEIVKQASCEEADCDCGCLDVSEECNCSGHWIGILGAEIKFTNTYEGGNRPPPVNPTSYKVTYYGNGNTGGTVPAVAWYIAGTVVTVAGRGDLVRDGYNFMGWRHDNGTAMQGGDTFIMPPRDVALMAIWEAIPQETTTKPKETTTAAETTTEGVTTTEATTEPIIDETTTPEPTTPEPTLEEPTVTETQPVINEPTTTADESLPKDGTDPTKETTFSEDMLTAPTDDEPKVNPPTGDMATYGFMLAILTTVVIAVVVGTKKKKESETV